MPLQVTGQFTANGNSGVCSAIARTPELGARFDLSLSGLTGTGATVTVQRSFDGSTWKNVQAYTADIETFGEEPSAGVQYRLACSGFASGTILYGIG
jgi:hypothetical protein